MGQCNKCGTHMHQGYTCNNCQTNTCNSGPAVSRCDVEAIVDQKSKSICNSISFNVEANYLVVNKCGETQKFMLYPCLHNVSVI